MQENLDTDADTVVIQVFRISCGTANFLHRGSSSLTETNRMDIEDLQLCVLDMETLHAFVTRAHQRGGHLIARVKKVVESLQLSLAQIACCIHLSHLDMEDKTYFVTSIERFLPKKFRTVDEIRDGNMSHNCFGFKKA